LKNDQQRLLEAESSSIPCNLGFIRHCIKLNQRYLSTQEALNISDIPYMLVELEMEGVAGAGEY
jgi:hypothetical protein